MKTKENKKNFNLPHNIELEKDLLNAVLNASEKDDSQSILSNLNEEDFYSKDSKIFFKALKSIFIEDNFYVAEPSLIINKLQSTKNKFNTSDYDEIDPSYLTSIFSKSVIFQEAYLLKEKLINYSFARKVIEISSLMINEAQISQSYEKLISQFQDKIDNLKNERSFDDNLFSANRAYTSFLAKIDESQTKKLVFKTNIKFIDKLTNGFKPSQLIIIAARPGCGKTAISIHMVAKALENSFDTKEKPLILMFNQEMSKEELISRLLANLSQMETKNFDSRKLQSNQIKRASQIISESRLFIDDTPGIYPEEIKAKCQKIKNKYGHISLVVIDYLQLLRTLKSSQNRQYEVADISRFMKILAKELETPILVLSQLSRDIEKREANLKGFNITEPKLSDLRDSGAIEQDADIVAFLYNKDKLSNKDENNINLEQTNIILSILKNRSGPIGQSQLIFDKPLMTFREKGQTSVKRIDEISILSDNKNKESELILSDEEVREYSKDPNNIYDSYLEDAIEKDMGLDT